MFTTHRNGTPRATFTHAIFAGLIVTIGLAAQGVASADESPPITLPPGFTIPPPSDPVITVPVDVTIPPTSGPVITLPPDVTIIPVTTPTTVPVTVPPTVSPTTVPSTQLPPPPPGPTTPSAPAGVVAKPGLGSVTVTWMPPVSNGGAAVSHYGVQRATNPAGPWTNAGYPSSTTFTDTGLTIGTKYYFRVHAYNVAGWGQWSATVSATPANVPSKPVNLTATPGVTSIKLSWQLPASDGGAPLLYYRVRVYSANCASKLTEFTTIALSTTYAIPDGSERCFFVNAVNAAGSGATSNVAKATAGRPLAPATCSITYHPNGDYLQVTWSATASWGGYAANGYHIVFIDEDGFENDDTVWTNQTNDVWLNPPTGQWHAEISAMNSAGEGPACTTTTVPVN